ncbi:histone transcription regulator 1 [Mycena floridula]|nr:histone transcription regulator 1 [Mycena floridula]
MHFTKPSWVQHTDPSAKSDSAKPLSIFSVHVHPDGSRIATGGLDARIRIWSTKPILNPASELSNKPPKSLCTLTMHTGPVLTVRWAHSGRWLASGSDDTIVMVWDLDPNARGRVWGSDEVNVEGWKPLKRLPGHGSDVTDVAWSPGDRYLASVGLDSQVMVWCGYTLERLHKLDQHQGFVKGVCWDPVGEFLATQSDDKSVKIWRTTDWTLEAEVTKPFEDSPGSTFFRRLSWSPDGAHITASNATNNKGFVFIAAVITRNTWTSEISLVGHENTVEVAAYNPHIFLRNVNAPVTTSNICSVVALGADDRSISIWQTKSARPLIVAKEVFERHIMDLSWSWDGLSLYAASSDGTLAVFSFQAEELDGIAPHSVQEQYLSKFGFTAPALPEGYSHEAPASLQPSSPRSHSQSQMHSQSSGFASTPAGGERVNVLVAKRSNKKRANLVHPSSIPSASVSAPESTRRASLLAPQDVAMSTPRPQTSFPQPDEQPYADVDMDSAIPYMSPKAKRKASEASEQVYRTLGGDRVRNSAPAKEISGTWVGASTSTIPSPILPVPALLTRLSVPVEDTDDILEAVNPEDLNEPVEVVYLSGKQTLWVDYLPNPVISIKATKGYCAAAMQDGTVNVYTRSGRRLFPTLSLGSPAAHIDGNATCLSIITSAGMLYSWKVNKQRASFPCVSIAPVVQSAPNISVTSIAVHGSCPILNCSNGVMYSYDPNLSTWIKLSEKWWSEGSDIWPGRQRNSTVSTRNIVAWLESNIDAPFDETAAQKHRPGWWNTAMTLGHLESKLHACRLLESPLEYKQALLVYARKLADEGFKAKAEELIKELFGPVYWRPGDTTREGDWSPTVVGMAKRDLLKEVLSQFAKNKALSKLAGDWQDLLKKAANEDM